MPLSPEKTIHTCPRCGAEFAPQRLTSSYCDDCQRAVNRANNARYRERKREDVRARNRAYQAANPDKNREAVARHREKERAQRRSRPAKPGTLTATQAAALLGMSRQRVYQLREAGELPRHLTLAAVEEYQRRRPARARDEE